MIQIPLSLIHIFFFHRKELVQHRKDPLRSFTFLWDKKFSTKPWSPPLLCMKTFRVRSYWSTEGFIYKFLRHCGTMNFHCRKVIYTSYEKMFRYPSFLKHWMVHPRNISALWDKRFWTENRVIPFSLEKLFDTRIFSMHWTVPKQNFSVLWDKQVWTKSRDTPPFG